LGQVLSPNILVNLVSRRVRQLNHGGGGAGRPLVSDIANLGATDIALREIIEAKIGFDLPEFVKPTRPSAKNAGGRSTGPESVSRYPGYVLVSRNP
jgi:hypothetical protein